MVMQGGLAAWLTMRFLTNWSQLIALMSTAEDSGLRVGEHAEALRRRTRFGGALLHNSTERCDTGEVGGVTPLLLSLAVSMRVGMLGDRERRRSGRLGRLSKAAIMSAAAWSTRSLRIATSGWHARLRSLGSESPEEARIFARMPSTAMTTEMTSVP